MKKKSKGFAVCSCWVSFGVILGFILWDV